MSNKPRIVRNVQIKEKTFHALKKFSRRRDHTMTRVVDDALNEKMAREQVTTKIVV